MKEGYQKHGEQVPQAPARKKYSGQFNVRIDRRLQRAQVIITLEILWNLIGSVSKNGISSA